jgi:hypothetical protein
MTEESNFDPNYMYNWIQEKSGKKANMETKQISMWTCNYCGMDTSNVDYDYLNGYDHLGCALEAEMKNKPDEFDHCVLCGVETAYKRSTHVDMRHGYIEGAGQLCPNCYSRGTERGAVAVDYNIILGTSNDQELGSKVRKLYWLNKNR